MVKQNSRTLKKKKFRDLSALEDDAKIHNHGHFKLISELLLCCVPQFLICKNEGAKAKQLFIGLTYVQSLA